MADDGEWWSARSHRLLPACELILISLGSQAGDSLWAQDPWDLDRLCSAVGWFIQLQSAFT